MINSIQTSEIRTLFNPENIYISEDGGGAGNIWASGYYQAEKVQEHLLDMIGNLTYHRVRILHLFQIERLSIVTV